MSSRSFGSVTVAALTLAALALAGCSNSERSSDKRVETATGVAAPTATATTSAAATSSTAQDQAEGISFDNAYIRAKGTDRSMTAIFGTITNNTDEAVILTSFSSEALGNVTYELHEVVNGVMQEHEGGFEIPAHSSFELKPGADHLMVMNIDRAIEAGDTIDLSFHFADGETVLIPSLAVRTTNSGDENYGSDGQLQSGNTMSTSATTSSAQ